MKQYIPFVIRQQDNINPLQQFLEEHRFRLLWSEFAQSERESVGCPTSGLNVTSSFIYTVSLAR